MLGSSLIFYSILLIINLILALTIVFVERRNIAVTWAWLMVLVLLPLVGFVLYIMLGQNLSKRRLYKIPEAHRLVARNFLSMIRQQSQQLADDNYPFNREVDQQYSGLIRMNLKHGWSYFTERNQVDIFIDGNEKFDALLQDIKAAQHHIHMLYFIVRPDSFGRKLINLLTEKARQGVVVRFLYDDVGSAGLKRAMPSEFSAFTEAGGQLAAFFPSRIPYLNFRLNYRNHRKLAIIDGRCGYIGGINIGEEYLGRDPRYGYWRDTHMRIEGPAIMQMQSQFILDWNLASAHLIIPERLYWEGHQMKGSESIQIVANGPNNQRESIKDAYIKIIQSAKHSVWLQTPYFVPDDSFLNALKISAMSGVDVRVMIPSKPDHKVVYWATYSYLEELLQAGARIFLYRKGFLHSKTIIADGTVCSIGTSNIDIRSFKLNFEVNAIVYGEQTSGRLLQIFEKDQEDCTELTLTAYRRRSIRQRIRESFARLLSPLL